MIVGNARQDTYAEQMFVRRAERQLRRGIRTTVILSQLAVLVVPLVLVGCLAAAIGLVFPMLHVLPWLGIDPLDGIPIVFVWVWPVICLLLVPLADTAVEMVNRLHDRVLSGAYTRWVEPWLLGLYYVNSPRAAEILTRFPEPYAGHRFVDRRLQRSLQSFAVGMIHPDPKQLLAELEDSSRRGLVISVLAADYRPELALKLVRDLHSRSPLRQEAEIDLYTEWLLRYPQARRSLLPMLEMLVADSAGDVRLRRHLARSLRRHRLSRVRVDSPLSEWPLSLLRPLSLCWRSGMSSLAFPVLLLSPVAPRPIRRRCSAALARWGCFGLISPGPGVLEFIAEVLIADGSREQAERLLRAALARYPDRLVLQFLAHGLRLERKIEEARTAARPTLEAAPQQPSAPASKVVNKS
jgi:hypothetical protein